MRTVQTNVIKAWRHSSYSSDDVLILNPQLLTFKYIFKSRKKHTNMLDLYNCNFYGLL